MDVIELVSSDEEPRVRVQPTRSAKRARDSPQLFRFRAQPLTSQSSCEPSQSVTQASPVPASQAALTPKRTPKVEPQPEPDRPAPPSTSGGDPGTACNGLIPEWKRIEDQLRCDICKQLLDVPVSLKCFHTFCSFCIRRYLELSGNDYCPSCRIPASSTDIRLEPRLAGILNVLAGDRGGTRKRFRSALRQAQPHPATSCKNETFNKQADLVALVKATPEGTSVTRTLLPLYKNLKDKQLKELLLADGVEAPETFSRDEMIRHHKEYLFTVQAAYDGVRMGMFPDTVPTKDALAKAFTAERRPKPLASGGRLVLRNQQQSASDQRREEADKAESIQALTASAHDRMAQQLRHALLKRKQAKTATFGQTEPAN